MVLPPFIFPSSSSSACTIISVLYKLMVLYCVSSVSVILWGHMVCLIFNLYHMVIGDLNPSTMGLPA
jgi:hypothetical protein